MNIRLGALLGVFLLSAALWGQNENKPVQKKFDIDPKSKSLLKLPEKNPLPDFLKKDFLRDNY